MQWPLFFLTTFFMLASGCNIKNSVFDTDLSGPSLWNQKFSVPSYNISGGDVARFAIITDSHQNYADLRSTIRHINNAGVQFAIHTGDFTDAGTRDEYELFIEYLKDIRVPLYVAPGNHDLTSTGRALYAKAFGAENRAVDTDFGKLIFWNNNSLEIHGRQDYGFISNEIGSANNSRPVFLFHHQDPFNKLTFTDAQDVQYTSILQSHPQVIVIHGHLHRFYTQTVSGIPFFQIHRTESQKWALVEVDNSNIRIYYCSKSQCSLESTL